MSAPLQNPSHILRKRMGEWLKQRREDVGHTQASAAAKLQLDWAALVSQVERGVTAVPAHDIVLWATMLDMTPEEFATKWLYYIQPSVYHALFGKDPYALERIPRPERTAKSAPGRPPLRSVRKP